MKKFGLIGEHLGHSFSKSYFEEKFEKLGIEASYENFEFSSVASIRSFFQDREIDGLNVTFPFKEAILSILDEVDEEAKEIGAVNCISIENGKWVGHNTDHYGFATSLKPFLTNLHEKALILGSGGASKAIKFALKKLSVPSFIVSRLEGRGDVTYSQLTEEHIKQFKLIVHCTPIGTYPNVEDKLEIPFDGIGKDHLIYDLVYNPEKSAFLLEGEAHGAAVMNGLNMLKLQAEKSWEWWTK